VLYEIGAHFIPRIDRILEVVLPDESDQIRIVLFEADRTFEQLRKVDLRKEVYIRLGKFRLIQVKSKDRLA